MHEAAAPAGPVHRRQSQRLCRPGPSWPLVGRHQLRLAGLLQLAATLAGDASPAVREEAAEALRLLGSPAALPALQRAAQLDSSHDVRRTAQFAIDIILSRD